MATNSEIKSSRKKSKKKKDDDDCVKVDIKRGTNSSNWQSFQSKKLRTESTSETNVMSNKQVGAKNSAKKFNVTKFREKENFTQRSDNVPTNVNIPTGQQSTSTNFKSSFNGPTKEKNSPVKRRTNRMQYKRNQINVSATPFVPRGSSSITSSSASFANMSLSHNEMVNDGIVSYVAMPAVVAPVENVQNMNFKPPPHLKAYISKTTFQIPFASTHSLAVTDLMFLRKPGVIGSVGTWPTVNEDVCVAMDCEMVGVGTGRESMLARVSLVNMSGDCIYDTFVLPQVRVVDFRTSVSGVRPKDVYYGADFHIVRQVVATLIHNRILVGHALKNDLEVLGISFPKKYIRDTAYYTPFKEKLNINGPPSLKRLARDILNINIQDGEHSSVEDARAAMQLYVLHRQEWEKYLRTRFYNRR